MYEEVVRKILIDVLEMDEIQSLNVDYDLTIVGLDSLNYMNLVVLLENYYNITIPIEDINFSKFKTIDDICKMIGEFSE